MKTLSLCIAGIMMISMSALAKPAVIDGESVLTLEGTVATMYRPNVDGDDAEVIKKCGKSYSALILKEPTKFEYVDFETGEKIMVVIHRLAIHAGSKVSKGLDKVSGIIREDLGGSCNSEDFGIYSK